MIVEEETTVMRRTAELARLNKVCFSLYTISIILDEVPWHSGSASFNLDGPVFKMNYGVFSLNVSIDTKSRNLFRCCQVRTTSIERTIGIEYFDLHEVYVNKR